MEKNFPSLAALATGVLAGMLFSSLLKSPSGAALSVSTPAQPTLESVQSLSSLVTTRVTVSDVQLTQLDGYTGGARAALLVRGDFTLGTDLSQARFTQVNNAAKTVVITLKRPSAGEPRVDLSRTRLISVTTTGLWEVVPDYGAKTVVADNAYRDAQALILRTSSEPIWRDQAMRQAESVIKAFVLSFGWAADVRWAAA